LLPPIGIGSRAPLHGRNQGDAFFHRTFQRIKRRGGAEFKYEALIGDRKPALDYRN
jgi:hypothetical protein